LAAVGCVLACLALTPAARRRRTAPPLLPWEVRPLELVLFLLYTLFGGIVASLVAAMLVKPLGVTGDNLIIFSNAAAQFGLVGGVLLFTASYPGRLQVAIGAPRHIVPTGLAAFLISLPLVLVGGIAWTSLMKLVGLPLDKQLSIDLFDRTQSHRWLLVLAVTAVVIAPVAEEMIFRAGLFRFLRTRLPRWAALLLPACLFAALHNNLPTFLQLATLGLVFALAYERTGLIGTAIVAHAAFNLNNILLLLAGVNS
jgi:membrane protease YdiL (CAAX protease family)